MLLDNIFSLISPSHFSLLFYFILFYFFLSFFHTIDLVESLAVANAEHRTIDGTVVHEMPGVSCGSNVVLRCPKREL
jgi:hypothetical protein